MYVECECRTLEPVTIVNDIKELLHKSVGEAFTAEGFVKLW